MNTQEIKEELKRLYPRSTDWKRISKKGTGDDTCRLFEDDEVNRVYVVGDEDLNFVEDTEWTFALWKDEYGVDTVSFATKEFWKKRKCIPDNIRGDELAAAFGLDMKFMSNLQENIFEVHDTKGLLANLKSIGFKRNKPMEDFMKNGG